MTAPHHHAGSTAPGPRQTAMARFKVVARPTFFGQVKAVLRKCFLTRARDPLPILINLGFALLVSLMLLLVGSGQNSAPSRKSQLNTFPKLADPAETCINVSTCVHIGIVNSTNIDPVLEQLNAIVTESERPHRVVTRIFGSEPQLLSHYWDAPRSLVSAVNFLDVQALLDAPFDSSADPQTVTLPEEQAAVAYSIYGNLTARTKDPISTRYVTLQAYVEYALINARRAQFGLTLLPPPLATTEKAPIPLLSWINTEFTRSSSFGFVGAFFVMYMAIDLWNSVFVDLATDKQNGIRDALTVQGLVPAAYSMALFCAHMLYNLPVVIVFTIICTASTFLYPLTDPVLLFTIMFLYLCTLMLFGLFMAALVDDPINGRYMSNAVFFLGLVLVVYESPAIWDPTFQRVTFGVAATSEAFMYLLSPLILARVFLILNANEAMGRSTNWALLANTTKASQLPFLMVCLVADIVLYTLLLWYADQVKHCNLPLGFVFSPAYWFPSRASSPRAPTADTLPRTAEVHSSSSSTTALEAPTPLMPTVTRMPGYDAIAANSHPDGPAISLHNVVKVFTALDRKGTRHVDKAFVQHLTLDIPRGSVVGLVAKNGEGKTTTMRMICGLLHATEGSIDVLGTRMTPMTARKAQSQIALCPQDNVLWPDLTCLEHLQVMAGIRGIQVVTGQGQGDQPEAMDKYLRQLLHDVYLGTRADAKASTLSGGQKRKLCMAMALLGSPPLILLDEPTANLDVYTRQHAWALIQQARAHSTIVLTSHSMEEIETVCDYVAILKRGHVRVVGSPLFIKSKFGSGYRLVIEPNPEAQFNLDKTLEVVRAHFGQAELVAHHPTSVLIHVRTAPTDASTSPNDVHAAQQDGNDDDDDVHEKAAEFMGQWDKLNQAHELGAASLSLGVMPLEDVFIALNDQWTAAEEAEMEEGAEEMDYDKWKKLWKKQAADKAKQHEVGVKG